MENQGEQWRARLEAQGWKAESLILLTRLLEEMVDHAASGGLALAGERMLTEQPTPIDWAMAYRAAPTFLTGMVTHIDPSISPLVPTVARPAILPVLDAPTRCPTCTHASFPNRISL